jgi:pyruvate,water dikinase
VRVLAHPGEITRLSPGEILVVPTTDPAWASAFLVARGLVIETGGMLCHGAILAREARIPAVTDVRGACRLLRDGTVVEVDGGRGVVRTITT